MYLLLLILLLNIVNNESANILLYFPTPSFSHQSVFKALSRGLLNRGHNLTIITALPYELGNGSKEIDLSEYNIHWHNAINSMTTHEKDVTLDAFDIFEGVLAVTKKQIADPRVQHIIKEGHFDLLIIEAMNLVVIEALAKHFKVPLIGISSLDIPIDVYEQLGTFLHPAEYPDPRNLPYFEINSLSERIMALLHYVSWHWKFLPKVDKYFIPVYEKAVGKYEKAYPLYDIIFANAHPVLGFKRATGDTIIDVTGIHIEQKKELPKHILDYLNGASDGAVLISMGTNPLTVRLDKIIFRKLKQCAQRSKRRFIWKCSNEGMVADEENIKCWKWLPQSDILRHHNMKLFIFQGGYQSFVEAALFGVPLLVSPLSGDQFMNSNKIKKFKIGKQFSLEDDDDKKFCQMINEVIDDTSYKENILKISRQLTDSPMEPLTKAVWWVEYVLRHGNTKHLQLPTSNLIAIAVYAELTFYLFLAALIAVGFMFLIKNYFSKKQSRYENQKIKKN